MDVELKYAQIDAPLCWHAIFGNAAPVAIEIGFGKCGFLLHLAAQQPAVNFIGIESSHKYYRKGGVKVQRAVLSNIRLMWGDATHIFKRYVPDHSVHRVYVNFPDPWPKKRHAKRRLCNPEFIALLAHKLIPAGQIEIATDAAAYMHQVQEVFQAHRDCYELVYACTSENHAYVRPYQSDYEQMYLKDGKTIYYAQYRTHS